MKKYLPIYKIGKFIDIGILGTGQFVQFDYVKENIDLLVELVSHGIELESIGTNKVYEKIYSKGMLIDYELSKYEDDSIRNLLFMDFLKIDHNKFLNLYSKKILIFGAGAAGGTLCYLLAQFGYRNIIIIDDDNIEISDIYKTVIYKKEEINRPKVCALQKYIIDNFGIKIKTIISSPNSKLSITSLIENENPDLIVKACDPDLSFRSHLNEICFKMKVPFIYMSYSFDRINIGPFFVPGLTKSDKEIEINFTKTNGKEYTFLNHKRLFSKFTIHPSISFNINILANIVLKEIVFFHLRELEYVFSLNKEVFFFPLTMRVFFKDLNK